MPIYQLDKKSPEFADETHWIAPDAVVIGSVSVASQVSIWFGTVIRGDNERITIGARSNVQELCMLHTDPGFPLKIGKGCTVGHKAILHGCTIGDNCLVGMGATILNGAKIGQNCLVGAGALVPEGREIPDNSLVVGAPGKVVRQLDDNALAMLRASADIYVANASRFREGLKQI